MSERLDAVLAALDVGLQDSSESHVYNDVAPTVEDVCVRCEVRDRFEDSDWCGPCRAFLLGDGPDPGIPFSGWSMVAGIPVGDNRYPAPRGGIRYVPPPDWVVNHRDGNPYNNDPANLEAVNPRRNVGGHTHVSWDRPSPAHGGVDYSNPYDYLPEWDRDTRMGIARTELEDWSDVARYVEQLRREEHLPASLPLRVTVEPRDHLGVTLSVEWSSVRVLSATLVDALTPVVSWVGDRVRGFTDWGRRVGMIGDDGQLTEEYRDMLLARDLAIYGEAFVNEDGHRVDPATVVSGILVSDDESRPVEPITRDADGNLVTRWVPPPTGDPRTDPLAAARQEVARQVNERYQSGLVTYNDGMPEDDEPMSGSSSDLLRILSRMVDDHLHRTDAVFAGDPIATVEGAAVFAPFDGTVSWCDEGAVSVTDGDGRTARFFHCDVPRSQTPRGH